MISHVQLFVCQFPTTPHCATPSSRHTLLYAIIFKTYKYNSSDPHPPSSFVYSTCTLKVSYHGMSKYKDWNFRILFLHHVYMFNNIIDIEVEITDDGSLSVLPLTMTMTN